jgi:hypothetical protein
LWLATLEAARPQIEALEASNLDRDDRVPLVSLDRFHAYVRSLRRILAERPSTDVVRAQTRERVRRFRERERAEAEA